MKTGLWESNTSVVLLGSEGGRDAGESERGRAGERERQGGRERELRREGGRERETEEGERGGRAGEREREGGQVAARWRRGFDVDAMSAAGVDLINFFKGWVDLRVSGKVRVDGDNTPLSFNVGVNLRKLTNQMTNRLDSSTFEFVSTH